MFERLPGITTKILRQIDHLLPLAPPVVLPIREKGLWNLPASYFYPSTHRWWTPVLSRAFKVKQGLRRAAKQQSIFHLWFHPFNLASQPEKLLRGLETIFVEVYRLRETGRLDNLTMGELARNLSADLKASSVQKTKF
jgi:hypothetical protein